MSGRLGIRGNEGGKGLTSSCTSSRVRRMCSICWSMGRAEMSGLCCGLSMVMMVPLLGVQAMRGNGGRAEVNRRVGKEQMSLLSDRMNCSSVFHLLCFRAC